MGNNRSRMSERGALLSGRSAASKTGTVMGSTHGLMSTALHHYNKACSFEDPFQSAGFPRSSEPLCS